MSNRASLTITRGDDRTWNVRLKNSQAQPIDLSNSEFVCTIRKEYSSDIIGNPSTAIVTAIEGHMTITVPSTMSALLDVQSGRRNSSYVIDLVQVKDNATTTLINGYLIVEERVTPMGVL